MPDTPETIEEDLLDYQSNYYISNYIIHEACQRYKEEYKKSWMPISFLEFYFLEWKLHSGVGDADIQNFFKTFTISYIPDLVAQYKSNFFSIISKSRNGKDEFLYKLGHKDYLYVDLGDPAVFQMVDPELYKSLKTVNSHVANGDELLDLKELYENYMIKQIVLLRQKQLPYEIQKKQEKAQSQDKQKAKVAPAVLPSPTNSAYDTMLVGQSSDVPNQKGKITRLFFPRLNLPSPYPTLSGKSRINSERRARRVLSTDRQIQLINRKKFNKVKYSTGFIQKRKVAAKPQKRKFDFDF